MAAADSWERSRNWEVVNETFRANSVYLGVGCEAHGGGEPIDRGEGHGIPSWLTTQHPHGLWPSSSSPEVWVCFPICKMKSLTAVSAISTSKGYQEGPMRLE